MTCKLARGRQPYSLRLAYFNKFIRYTNSRSRPTLFRLPAFPPRCCYWHQVYIQIMLTLKLYARPFLPDFSSYFYHSIDGHASTAFSWCYIQFGDQERNILSENKQAKLDSSAGNGRVWTCCATSCRTKLSILDQVTHTTYNVIGHTWLHILSFRRLLAYSSCNYTQATFWASQPGKEIDPLHNWRPYK